MVDILVVDDEQSLRKLISKALKTTAIPMGQIHEASNGLEALQHLRKYPKIGLVLTDLDMGVMSGWELIGRIKNDPFCDHILVVAISGMLTQDKIQQLKTAGVEHFISKLIRVSLLVKRLKEFIPTPLSVLIDTKNHR